MIASAATALLLAASAFADLGPGSVISGYDVVTQKPYAVALKDSAKATVAVFLSAHCPCSAGHETALKKLYDDFGAKGFVFVGVHSNANESVALAREHFERAGLPFPVLQDNGAKLADELGALKTPHVFVLDKAGKILFSGGVDDSKSGLAVERHYLLSALSRINEGKPADPSEVKTLGCVIERP